MPPHRVVPAYSASQYRRGGVCGQYTAIAHFLMSDSEMGNETVSAPQTPFSCSIWGVTRVSTSVTALLSWRSPPASWGSTWGFTEVRPVDITYNTRVAGAVLRRAGGSRWPS